MPLSWNEIKQRAITFQHEWQDESREEAEAKSFWDGFFHIFGISRRKVAVFERHVRKIDNRHGFMDLFWKGVLLVEHKSRGQDLDKAFDQAVDYLPGLFDEAEMPRYILVSDFARFRLYDLDDDSQVEFPLAQLTENINHFGFIAGYIKKEFKPEDPVNIKAAELMGELHDQLAANDYVGHDLERLLVRILFCLFADDSGIFDERGIFGEYIEGKTKEDGSDAGYHLAMIFQVMNTPPEKRQKSLDEDLRRLAYINGDLFAEALPLASFDSRMRRTLLKCCYFDWSRISPAVFGSLFQSIMDPERRRNLGAHYTREQNILKLIKPLFLDDLRREFEKVKHSQRELKGFHQKLARLKFLDPACGCGNFLIVAYRELRLLELEIIKVLQQGQQSLAISELACINIDQFYGIEIEEFPVRVAEVALWLMDHQMNMRLSVEFGQYFARVPLTTSAHIVHANAIPLDWASVAPKNELSYILGNPPFVGKQFRTAAQNTDMERVFADVKGAGVLDYVAAWYIKAAQYIQGTQIKAAFVSTNSITQGEQVGILWQELFTRYKLKIHLAHGTFKWSSEAKDAAAVYCVIIGFANYDAAEKLLYEYETVVSEPHALPVNNINPYLVDAGDVVISKRTTPICAVPPIVFGSMPNDGGGLLLSEDERLELLEKEPGAEKFIRRFVGSEEFINNIPRWCLWLAEAAPTDLMTLPEVQKRVERVKKHRSQSQRKTTQSLASRPTLFGEIRQPDSDYVIVPRVSSENRKYIPFGFLEKTVIAGDAALVIPNATRYHFGILTSAMHMAWVKRTCGRLKSDYRYSAGIVYNNFPWPDAPDKKRVAAVEKAAQDVLDVRAKYPDNSLADLYHPLLMLPGLVKAHQALDRAVDRCYRKQPFADERNRLEFLFDLYNQYTAPLAITPMKRREKRPRKRDPLCP